MGTAKTIALITEQEMHGGMYRADHLLTVVFSDTPRKAHFWGSVRCHVNATQKYMTIIACLQN